MTQTKGETSPSYASPLPTESTGTRLARELRERRPERIPRIIAELTRRIEERQAQKSRAA